MSNDEGLELTDRDVVGYIRDNHHGHAFGKRDWEQPYKCDCGLDQREPRAELLRMPLHEICPNARSHGFVLEKLRVLFPLSCGEWLK